MGDSEWTEQIADIDEGIAAVVVFRVVIKGEPEVGEPENLKLVGLAYKNASLNAPNKGTELSLAMVSRSMWGREKVHPSDER